MDTACVGGKGVGGWGEREGVLETLCMRTSVELGVSSAPLLSEVSGRSISGSGLSLQGGEVGCGWLRQVFVSDVRGVPVVRWCDDKARH